MSLVSMLIADRIESATRYYDRWMNLITWGQDKRVREAVLGHISAGDRVLDVGAGTGSLTAHIALLVGHVTCTDLASEMLEKAKVRLAHFDHVDYRVEDATALSLEDNAFDIVLCCNVLHQMANPEAALKEFCRVIRTGGKLLAITITIGDMSLWAKLRTAIQYALRFGVPPASHPFALSTFSQLIAEAGFDVIEALLVTREPLPTAYVSAFKARH